MTPILADFWTPNSTTMRLVLPELVLIGTIISVLLAPLLTRKSTYATALIALSGCLLCFLAAWCMPQPAVDLGQELFGIPVSGGDAGPGMLAADRLGNFFRLFLMPFLLAIIAMWLLFDADREQHATEFFVLLLTSALGMIFMAGATNLLMMVIAIELASLPSYALAGFDKFRRKSSEAAVKYAVFGAATSGFMIYGVSLLYGMCGTLHIPTLVARLAEQPAVSPLLAVALLAVFAGIAFKISAVPFHFWCPDVFEGASLPVATWLSVASKGAGLILLLRLVFIFAGESGRVYSESVLPILRYGIGFFAILTCTFANLAAFRQTNVRRMLAYSSIAHAGYMLMAGAITYRVDGYENPLSGVLAYLLVYLFMNLGAFFTLGLVAADSGSEDIKAFSNLGFRDPLLAVAMTVCLISLVGLPPFGGFIVKWWLLTALGGAAQAKAMPFLWVLVAAVAVNTAISLYYYARLVWQMFFVPADGGPLRAPFIGKGIVYACAGMLLITGTVGIGVLKDRADSFVENMYDPQIFVSPSRGVESRPTDVLTVAAANSSPKTESDAPPPPSPSAAYGE